MKERPPIEYHRLQELARANDNPEVRELLWEIKRLHGVLGACRDAVDQIRSSWAHEVGGSLAGIEMLRKRLLDDPSYFYADPPMTRLERKQAKWR